MTGTASGGGGLATTATIATGHVLMHLLKHVVQGVLLRLVLELFDAFSGFFVDQVLESSSTTRNAAASVSTTTGVSVVVAGAIATAKPWPG